MVGRLQVNFQAHKPLQLFFLFDYSILFTLNWLRVLLFDIFKISHLRIFTFCSAVSNLKIKLKQLKPIKFSLRSNEMFINKMHIALMEITRLCRVLEVSGSYYKSKLELKSNSSENLPVNFNFYYY